MKIQGTPQTKDSSFYQVGLWSRSRTMMATIASQVPFVLFLEVMYPIVIFDEMMFCGNHEQGFVWEPKSDVTDSSVTQQCENNDFKPGFNKCCWKCDPDKDLYGVEYFFERLAIGFLDSMIGLQGNMRTIHVILSLEEGNLKNAFFNGTTDSKSDHFLGSELPTHPFESQKNELPFTEH